VAIKLSPTENCIFNIVPNRFEILNMDALVLKDSITGSMTDKEFLKFCLENPGLRIERNNRLEIIIMSPVTSLSGFFSAEVCGQLRDWNKKSKTGIVFDSSAGFTLPDRSVFSPDASWISKDKWNSLSEEDKNTFAPLCPEFIIEVRSKSDSLLDLKRKMGIWIANNAQLAWLIDPIDKKSYYFLTDGSIQEIEGFDKNLIGRSPVEGFELDLSSLEV
jgi:Uma2 family endonuclease